VVPESFGYNHNEPIAYSKYVKAGGRSKGASERVYEQVDIK